MARREVALRRQQADVLLAVASGLSKHAAAAKAGISYRTVARWQAEDEVFAESIEAAINQARASAEERVVAASDKDWRAAAWWLDYLDGVKRGKAFAQATVVIGTAPSPAPALTEEERAVILERAQSVVRVLVASTSPERAAEILAAREEEQRQIG